VIGRRQLVTIGGYDKGASSWINWTFNYQNPDPLTQGIGIFDMTAMEWMPYYNASAAPYETPKVVKDWYAEGYV
jgi:hypothetical protein